MKKEFSVKSILSRRRMGKSTVGVTAIFLLFTFFSCERGYPEKPDKRFYLKKDSAKVAAERQVFLAAEMNSRVKILVLPSVSESKDTTTFKNVMSISYMGPIGIDWYFREFLKETNLYNVIELKDSSLHRFYSAKRYFNRSGFKDFEQIFKPDIVVLSKFTTMSYKKYTYTYKVKIYSPAMGQEINSVQQNELLQYNELDSNIIRKKKKYLNDVYRLAQKIRPNSKLSYRHAAAFPP